MAPEPNAPPVRSVIGPTLPTDAQLPPLLLVDQGPGRAILQSALNGKIHFRTPEGKELSVSMDELVRWGTPAELHRGPVVLLADGSFLVGQVARMAAMLLDVEPDLLESKGSSSLRLPVGQVVGLLFRLPIELPERDRLLDRLHREGPDEDRLWLLNGDELRGRLETLEDRLMRFTGPLGEMSVEVSRLRAVQFRRLPQPTANPEGRRIWVGLRDGSLLLAQQFVLQQAKAELTLPGNLLLQTDRDNVVFLQPMGGLVVYLSDLTPKQYQFEPFFERHWPWQADRSVIGSWLRSGNRRYLKGLGVHSKASLKYELRGRYRRLEAELALDDTSAGKGCVVYRVIADGKQLFQSPNVSSGDPPLPLRLDISNVHELELVVDYGPWGDRMDRANWLDARLIPVPPP